MIAYSVTFVKNYKRINMKTQKLIFWVSTGVFSALMLFSSYSYLTAEEMKAAFKHLGFSDYFRVELAVAKLLGAISLLLPAVPRPIKIMAYCGFLITVVSAFIAHASSGDPLAAVVTPLIVLAILVTSYIYFDKLDRNKVSHKKGQLL